MVKTPKINTKHKLENKTLQKHSEMFKIVKNTRKCYEIQTSAVCTVWKTFLVEVRIIITEVAPPLFVGIMCYDLQYTCAN